jgi:hypothetical protein
VKHPSKEDILAYVSERLPEEDSFRLETHLAECDECAEKAYQYNLLRDHPDEIWDALSVQNVAKEVLALRLMHSLEHAAVRPDLVGRIRVWIKDFSNRTLGVAGIAVNKSKRTLEIIEEGVEALKRIGQMPWFAPAPQGVRVLGEGTDSFVEHQERLGPCGEKIIIYFSKGLIQFKITPLSFEQPYPLLWLLPLKEGKSILIETYRPEETDYLVAELSTEEVMDLNHYAILLEKRRHGHG